MVFWNCSDRVVFFAFTFISTIFLWYFGTVPTEWYFLFIILFLRFFYGILELFRQSGIFCFHFYFYDFSMVFWNCSDRVVFFAFTFISTIFLWYFGTVPTEWYFLLSLLFLRFFYDILELFRQSGIFCFHFYFYDFSMVFWNCSDRVVFFAFTFISTIFLWYFGTVPTEWYFLLSLLFLRFFYGILELFRQSGIFCFHFYFYDFSMVFWNCSDRVVFFVFNFISTIFLWYFGTIPTEWYFLLSLLFLRFFYGILELFRQSGIFCFHFYFYDFSMVFWNCSDRVVFFAFTFISTIFLWYFGTVPTEWYFLFSLLFLRFFYGILELFRQSGIFCF